MSSDKFHQETNEFGHWGLFDNEKAREVIVDLWRAQQVAYRPDLAEEDRYQEAKWMYESRSVVDVPFTQGTLAVNNPMPHAFSDGHIEVLKKIALVIAEGFQRREDLNRLENRNSLLETEINKHKETEEALQNARDELEKHVDERTAQLGTANAQLHREIIKHQQAVAALQAGEERLRLALQATNEGVWEVDFVKDTVWRSEGCERLLGVQPEKSEPSFIWWTDQLHPDDRQGTVDSFNAAQEGDTDHWSAEYRLRRFNGSYGVFLDRAYIARDKTGKATRAVGAMHDITEWRQAEEERLNYQWQLRTLASELNSAEDRERKRLAVDLHDGIGQVLSVVQMKMKMLGTGCLAVEQVALVDQVNELLERMDEDLGQLVFELFPPMLHELGLRESLEWLADQFKDQYGLQVQVEDDMQPKPLSEDRHSMVFRAMRELLFNVVKHAQSKNATVSLRKKGEVVCLEVADNGQGFDPSMINDRVPHSNVFGLFNIKERIDHIGGKLQVDSAPGRGTHCLLEIPLETQGVTL